MYMIYIKIYKKLQIIHTYRKPNTEQKKIYDIYVFLLLHIFVLCARAFTKITN